MSANQSSSGTAEPQPLGNPNSGSMRPPYQSAPRVVLPPQRPQSDAEAQAIRAATRKSAQAFLTTVKTLSTPKHGQRGGSSGSRSRSDDGGNEEVKEDDDGEGVEAGAETPPRQKGDDEEETSDDSWSGAEESSAGEEDSDEDWSEEERKNKRRKAAPLPPQRRAGAPSSTSMRQTQAPRQKTQSKKPSAYSTPVFPPRAVMVSQSNYAFEFDIQSDFNMYTVDVVIGNFVNALEGACETQGNASSMSWLSEYPPPNYSSGSIIVRPVAMRMPAMAGRWMAGHFISSLGCCGIMFWHTLYVGPNAQAAVDLIKDFARNGMEIVENNERDNLRNKGLRIIGRYSWDYYRQYGGGGFRIPQLASNLFGGPHCFFLPADEYRNKIYPDILTRVTEFDNGAPDAQFQPYLNKVNTNGALGVFPNQEYMFAKVFLQPDSFTNRTRWVGVRAVLCYTYNVGETWNDCRIENVPIDVQAVNVNAVNPPV